MEPRELIDFLKIPEKLKCNTRHSWTSSNRKESVAEHSFRLCMIADLLRKEFPDLDMDKVVRMCLWHDMGEAVTGDIPSFQKSQAHEDVEKAAVDQVLEKLDSEVERELKLLFEEMEALETKEAKLYKALDKLECIIQHNEADLSTWLPLEYTENITYGSKEVLWSPYLTRLKEEIKQDTLKKIKQEDIVMENFKAKFLELFEEENKEELVSFCLNALEQGEIDVLDLYTTVLTPALNDMVCKLEEKRICIWKEHVKTGLVRTIVECAYPYVVKKRDSLGAKKDLTAVVICPPEEYHDLGARMVVDFFTICGCHSVFVGSNTPYQDFYNAIDIIRPDIVAVSVSNYYNLVVTKKIITDVKAAMNYPVKIVVGGSAFMLEDDKYKVIGADYLAKTFDDIKMIVEAR